MTPDEILDWLRERPADALAVVNGLRIAGPWDGWTSEAVHPSPHSEYGAERVCAISKDDDEEGWYAYTPDFQDGFATEAEAKAWADGKAREDGWVLIPGEKVLFRDGPPPITPELRENFVAVATEIMRNAPLLAHFHSKGEVG